MANQQSQTDAELLTDFCRDKGILAGRRASIEEVIGRVTSMARKSQWMPVRPPARIGRSGCLPISLDILQARYHPARNKYTTATNLLIGQSN